MLLMAGSLLLPFASAKVPPSQKDIEKNVRKVAEQVCQAVKELDADAVMKVADVPWWHNTGNDRNRVFTKRDELANFWKETWSSSIKRPKLGQSLKITKIVSYKEERQKFSLAKQKMMEQVLTLDDWVVWIARAKDKGGPQTMLFVGRRNGQWKFIGVDDRV